MTDRESRMFELYMRYCDKFGDGSGYPLEMAPPKTEDELIALYERCLREGKPWEAFVEWRPDPNVIY